MDRDQDKWMENIFHSMKGSQRAQPPSNLFTKIESQITSSKVKIVPRLSLRFVAVAATLILVLNISALLVYTQQNKASQMHSALQDSDNNTLITSFQIYD